MNGREWVENETMPVSLCIGIVECNDKIFWYVEIQDTFHKRSGKQ